MNPFAIDIPPATALKVRRILRTLCDEADSVLALYAIDRWREFYGNHKFIPSALPVAKCTVPSWETVRIGGEDANAVCQRVRLTGDMYRVSALWCISPDVPSTEVATAFRETTEALEDAIFPLLR